ncbi:MAG TPA: undecaprenyldiphospho-muramoylpentapeptide beta-N-acetylglucosaminyltransferase [Bryobacteraceae bacterium]
MSGRAGLSPHGASAPLPHSFVLTGGGTGGHVFPALAVARILQERGHKLLFIGTRTGIEARLAAEAGLEMQSITIGQLNRAGIRRQLQTAAQLPFSIWAAWRILGRFRPQAVFSTGGYVAGPVMAAAILARIPLVVMEPNAIPGFSNRKVAKHVYRALLGFEAAARWFPPGKSEVTGLPVRPEFFHLQPKRGGPFTVLITGGSRGARRLNSASRESWKFFREREAPVRIVHQTGSAEHDALAKEFQSVGIDGQVVPFIQNMVEAFAQADLVVARSGAGSVNEIAAAGMPSILVPLPFAADDHQRKNAEALAAAGAARIIPDGEMSGERLFREVESLRQNPEELAAMRERVLRFAHPGAAQRATEVLAQACEAAG